MSLYTTYEKAFEVLERCSTDAGFVACAHQGENYHRIWSRDAMIAGLAVVVAGNTSFREVFRCSIETLAHAQGSHGQIPSNVDPANGNKASYGSLSGRVDATTWWLCGLGVYLKSYEDKDLMRRMSIRVENAIRVLEVWEYNGRGLVYTPAGGNWADEYPVQGFTLYDQCLRMWGLHLMGEIYQRDDWKAAAQSLHELVRLNFNNNTKGEHYHASAWQSWSEKMLPYMASQFSAEGYSDRWDAAGNALAMLLGLNENTEKTSVFIHDQFVNNSDGLVPAFYPIIGAEDAEWNALQRHFNYQFKNLPGHFHNGGIWPVWTGFLNAALALGQQPAIVEMLHQKLFEKMSTAEGASFYEYYSALDKAWGGKPEMAFTASGCILSHHAAQNELSILKQLLP